MASNSSDSQTECNQTGQELLSLLEQGLSWSAILTSLEQRYQIEGGPQRLFADCAEFIAQCSTAGMLPAGANLQRIDELFLAITDRCNIACKHCNAWSSRNAAELKAEEIDYLRTALRYYALNSITISGGEPFAHAAFPEVLQRLERFQVPYSINTNGTLLDEAHLGPLADAAHVTSLLIGLDGPDDAVRGTLRAGGSISQIAAGIDLVKKRLPSLKLSFFVVVNRRNCGYLREIASLAASLGGTQVQFEPLLPLGRALGNFRELELTDKQWRAVFDQVAELKAMYGPLISGNYASMKGYFEQQSSAARSEGNGCFRTCSGGKTKVCIRADGEVTPCDRLWDFSAGNVFKQELVDIVQHGKAMLSMRERGEVAMAGADEQCAQCRYSLHCGGGCPAVPQALHGTLLKPDYQSCIARYCGER